jgi:F420-non-reducing hydrogenase small subunit
VSWSDDVVLSGHVAVAANRSTTGAKPMEQRKSLAVYWASSCGGCEISVVNLHEHLLEATEVFDLVFCPCLVDGKISDVRAMPDGAIDVTLFNGAIRTGENEEMAHLLRRKSKVLIAYGSCAAFGCIPALSNLHSREAHWQAIYLDNVSTRNQEGVLPVVSTAVPEGELRLPRFFERVRTLAQTVEVDYSIPGCPPESHQLWNALVALITGPPPPRGAVLGAGHSSVCDECGRERHDKRISALRRNWEIIPDSTTCLLEQGLVCMGVATRDGCGALCPQVNMPCIGCYGPPEGVVDQGGKFVAALGSMIDIEPLKGLPEEEIAGRIDAVLDGLPDCAGTFYKFSLAASLLRAARPTATTEVR